MCVGAPRPSAPSREVGGKLKPSIEGADGKNGEGGDDHWMLVDCGSCVVHVFSAEAREMYDLEDLWAPGQVLEKRNPEEERMTIDTIRVLPGDGDVDAEAGAGGDGVEEVGIDLDGMGPLEVRRGRVLVALPHARRVPPFLFFFLFPLFLSEMTTTTTTTRGPRDFCADEVQHFLISR